MKKVLTLIVAVFLIFGAYVRPAHAEPIAVPAGFALASASAGQMAAVVGSAAAFSVFIYLNTTGEKPFEKAFEVVDYSYPQDPHGFDHVVVENGVQINARKVSYQTPESLKYTYQDELGVHHL